MRTKDNKLLKNAKHVVNISLNMSMNYMQHQYYEHIKIVANHEPNRCYKGRKMEQITNIISREKESKIY